MPRTQKLPNTNKYFFPELTALYEAALKFRQLSPWKWMRDSDIFAVQSPDTGEFVYCSVMGAIGEFYGISCYRGDAGYLVLDSMYDQIGPFGSGKTLTETDPIEAAALQNTLLISFGPKSALSLEEANNIKRLGLTFKGKQAYPSFESFVPNYASSPFEQHEAIFAITILEQAYEICSRFEKERTLLTNIFDAKHSPAKRDHKEIFAYLASRTPSGIVWQSSYIPRPKQPKKITVEVSELTPAAVKRLESYPVRKVAWEFDYFYLPASINTDEQKAFYPRVLMIVDRNSQAIIANRLAKPSSFSEDVFDTIIDAIENAQVRPAQIQIRRSGEFLVFVDAFCHEVKGMSHVLVPGLSISSQIQREMRQMLLSGRF